MCGASRYDDPFYYTFALVAPLSPPAINPVTDLEIAGTPVGLKVVADGTSSTADRFDQDFPHFPVEGPGPFRGEGAGRFQGVNMRGEETLVDVYVTKPREVFLIEQK